MLDDDDAGAGGTIKAEMRNFVHVAYVGPLSFGLTDANPPAAQDAYVVYDTGSGWLTVGSSLCAYCALTPYAVEASTTGSRGDYRSEQERYGPATVVGQPVTDDVCIAGPDVDPDRNTCVDDFRFLAITWADKFRYQGVLGFAPENATDAVPNFLQSLRNQGKIGLAQVSFSLGHNSTFRDESVPSYAIFGGVDETEYIEPLESLALATPYYWAPRVEGVAYGGVYIAKFDSTEDRLGVLDTGTALIHLPKTYYNILVSMWQRQLPASTTGFAKGRSGLWEARGDCSQYVSRVSNFSVIFDGLVFEITPQAYLMNCTDFRKTHCSSPDNCAFGIDSMDTELGEFNEKIFLLGDTFLKNFYSVFSAEGAEASVSLALSKHYQDQAGVRPVASEAAGFTLSMFLMFALTGGLFYVYSNHQKIWMEKRISSIMFLFRMDLARERGLTGGANEKAATKIP